MPSCSGSRTRREAKSRSICVGTNRERGENRRAVVFSFATRIIVLVAGKLMVDAAPEVVRADSRVKEAYFGEEI